MFSSLYQEGRISCKNLKSLSSGSSCHTWAPCCSRLSHSVMRLQISRVQGIALTSHVTKSLFWAISPGFECVALAVED